MSLCGVSVGQILHPASAPIHGIYRMRGVEMEWTLTTSWCMVQLRSAVWSAGCLARAGCGSKSVLFVTGIAQPVSFVALPVPCHSMGSGVG